MHNFQMESPVDQRDRLRVLYRQREQLGLKKRLGQDADRDRAFTLEREPVANLSERVMLGGRAGDRMAGLNRFMMDRDRDGRLGGGGGDGDRSAVVERMVDEAGIGLSRMEGAAVIARPMESGGGVEAGVGVDRRLEGGAERRLEVASDLKEDREGARAGGRSASFQRSRSINREKEEREKARERAREDNGMMERGGQREKQKEGSAGSFQELVAQYKTALGELTFNSKPIITNLTIIAGENVHAATAIAATVCDHILEVPNEQKLPSLYLLDSIVKNIGGDYVKHFAARLAEVFCASYKQVDPSTYPAMRHLFRTWRGVFPGAPLRIIETELQFPPLTNGPSLTTNSSKSAESPSQHPGHSIHVNPKYLEAQKQRLQHSTRADETVSIEINGESRICEAELPERVVLDNEKNWLDESKRAPPLPRIRNDGFARKVPLSFLDYDYGSGDRGPDIERRVVDREETLDRGWLRESEDAFRMTESGSGHLYNQRNELRQLSPRALVDAYGNGRGPRAPRIPPPPPPAPAQPVQDLEKGRGLSRNWQNSEEEEYSWENMSHRLSEHGQIREGMRKDGWLLGDVDKNFVPGWFGRGKPFGLDQQLSDHGGWRRFGSMPLTSRPQSAERKPSLHRVADERVPLSLSILQQGIVASTVSDGLDVPSLGVNYHSVLGQRSLAGQPAHHLPQHLSPPSQSRLRPLPLVTVPNRTPPLTSVGTVLSQTANLSTPFSTSVVTSIIGSSVTIQESTRPAMSSLYGGELLNFGSLSSVTPTSSLNSQQRKQPQRPLSPTVLTRPSQSRLPPVLPNSSLLQPNFQPSQHQRVNGLKPVQQATEMLQLQQNASLHILQQQQPVQLHPHAQAVQQPVEQLQPLQQFIKPLTIPLSQPTSEQQLVLQQQSFQTTAALPQLPTQLLHSLQQLQHHLPPHVGTSMRQSQSSQSSQQLQVPLVPTQQIQLPQLQPLQPPSQNHMPPQPEQSPQRPQLPGYVAPPVGTPMNGNSSSSGSQGHGNANNLLAAFLQSGIMPPSQALQMLPHLRPSTPPNISTGPNESTTAEVSSQLQPPLPSGPPPVQLPISGAGPTLTQRALSLPPTAVTLVPRPLPLLSGLPSNLPAFAFQPPLPPGPPPVSSQSVNSVTQSLTSVGRQPPVNNLSTLFSSLMAQGLISASSSSATPVLPQTGMVLCNSNNTTGAVAFPKSNLGLVSSVSPLVPVVGSFISAVATVPATLVTALRTQVEAGHTDNPSDQTSSSVDCIGTEFKQEILRERHESVIKALYIDFPRQCKTCGLRFKLQEEHSKHMDWHVSRNRQLKSSKKISRKWFASVKEWLGGTGPSASEVAPSFLPEDVPVKLEDHDRVAVPADENQSACALCGEPFEDFYSDETEEWMYKGAVYMNAPPGGINEGMDSSRWGPIVHAKCRSESTATGAVDSAEEDEGEEDDDLGHTRKKMRY